MDASWNFRQAYNTANEIKISQDAFCDAVENGDWESVDGKSVPEDYQWESLVDVLRGKVRVRSSLSAAGFFEKLTIVCVKLSVHCYEVGFALAITVSHNDVQPFRLSIST